MQVKLIRNYRAKSGNVTFVYAVTGSTADLEAYKSAQGKFYREDEDGTPLWFTVNCIGKKGNLVITSKGKVVPDMSAFEAAASLAKQFGGNFGDMLAKGLLQDLIGGGNEESEE